MKLLITLAALLSVATPLAAHAADAEYFEQLEHRNIGPFRGGRVTAVAGHPAKPYTFFMGATGGIFRTTNAGQSWEQVGVEDFKTASVGAIDVAPSDPSLVLVGMGESPYRGVASSHGDGVYKSVDGGHRWTHLGLDNARQISSVKFHPKNPEIVWVAVQGSPWAPTSQRGVYRSINGGASFERVLFVNETSGAVDLKYDPTNPHIVYASLWDSQRTPWQIRSGGDGSGLYKSTDAGATWTKLSEGLPEGTLGKMGIAPSGAQEGLVWAIIENKEKGGLYKSTDFGETWSHVNGDRRLHARSWYYMHVFAHPSDANTVMVLNAPFMRSIDGGKSFAPVSVPHGDTHDLWINPEQPEIMINANDGGGTVTLNDGKSWSTIYNQPTVQFYRVSVDNQVPYKLYGGQQDNSTVAVLSRGADGSIGPEDFHSVGGCESGHSAFDPDNPRFVYSGCYLGLIEEYDHQTKTSRDVRVYPELAFGVSPKDRKYRFNWNAPITASPHDPSVIYHGGNRVFKTTDRGNSWTAISPDLTRDETDKQGPMGLPITNEVSENYNTLLVITESMHEAGTIWTGSDDGRVHMTRNGGESWNEVTPSAVNGGMINSIDVSPHDPARAYMVSTRYKYNDHRSYIFVTENYGRSWRRLDRGLPDGASFTRVVREDSERAGLLYAGTEKGLYLSFNAGRDWQAMKLNMPTIPITDIKVHGRDLVMSTQGRGFWIFDDVSPFRQLTDRVESDDFFLFKPEAAFWFDGEGGRNGGPVAPNPPNGAVIHYALKAEPDLAETTLKLEVLDADGTVLRTLKSDAEKGVDGGGSGAALKLPAHAGINRVVWDMRVDPLAEIKGQWSIGAGGKGQMEGYRLPPGDYRLRLSLGDDVREQPITLNWDPHFDVDAAKIAEQQSLTRQTYAMVDEFQRSVIALRSAKAQAEARIALIKDNDSEKELKEAGEKLAKAVTDFEAGLLNTKREFFQDVLNWPDRLHTNLQLLAGDLDGSRRGVTEGAKQRFADLKARFDDAMGARDSIIGGEIAAYNTAFDAAQSTGIVLPETASKVPATP